MVVQEQIDDAEYFLNILRTKYERNEMRPNLTVFLALARSIPDYLLEGYNKIFGVNIPLSKSLTIDKFREKAGRDINQTALRFINFYENEFESLKQDTIVKYLLDKRNIKIHRQIHNYTKKLKSISQKQ